MRGKRVTGILELRKRGGQFLLLVILLRGAEAFLRS
jgi:hypothetical protein